MTATGWCPARCVRLGAYAKEKAAVSIGHDRDRLVLTGVPERTPSATGIRASSPVPRSPRSSADRCTGADTIRNGYPGFVAGATFAQKLG